MTLTVLMPAFNASRFIGEAIDSVLRQTHCDFELLVVDDGSTDGTLAVAQSYAARDPRVRVTSHANVGIANTLNGALDSIASDWVVCMHADDVMLPDRVARQLAFVHENPDVAVAGSHVVLIDAAGREIGRSRSHLTSRQAVERAVFEGQCVAFHHPAVMFRRSVIAAVGGYRQAFWPAEDTELWNRVVDAGHLVLVQPEYLLKYRLHASSASMSKSRLMVQKLAWMERCMQARRDRRPEPTWDQFLEARRCGPAFSRVNAGRRELARTLYQSALGHYAAGAFGRMLPTMAAATALEPSLVLPRVLKRLSPV
jgi:glycosyltransferase involved in cell wall biosynthesis